MQNATLWRGLLGVEKTVVEDVEFDEDAQLLIAHVRPRRRSGGRCGRCGRRSPGYVGRCGLRRSRGSSQPHRRPAQAPPPREDRCEDAEASPRETLADPQLPPAGKDAAPSPASNELDVLRDWRESLVLQRVRLLTEAESVLVSLPLGLREQLPATSRVLASLKRLAELENFDAGLSAGDRLKLDRLAASRADIVAISARIKDLDAQIQRS